MSKTLLLCLSLGCLALGTYVFSREIELSKTLLLGLILGCLALGTYIKVAVTPNLRSSTPPAAVQTEEPPLADPELRPMVVGLIEVIRTGEVIPRDKRGFTAIEVTWNGIPFDISENGLVWSQHKGDLVRVHEAFTPREKEAVSLAAINRVRTEDAKTAAAIKQEAEALLREAAGCAKRGD